MNKTLEEIRILPVADLLDEDKKTLKDSWNDLTPEEQDVFDDAVNSSDDTPLEGTPPADTPPADDLPFKTQKEVDDYIDKKLAEKEDEGEPPPADDGGEPPMEVPDIFEKGKDPTSWNEAFRTMMQKGGKVITEMTRAALQKEQKVLRDQVDKINKQIDSDIDALAKDGKDIPALGTPERGKLNEDLGKIATDYNMNSAPAAKVYEIYELLNNPDPTGEPRRKSLARNVSGGGNAGGTGAKTAPEYKDIRDKSMTTLLEEQGV